MASSSECPVVEVHTGRVDISVVMLEIRKEIGWPFFKDRIFYRLLCHCFIENTLEGIGPIKIDFGWLNAKIGWKMANGRLIFLAKVFAD